MIIGSGWVKESKDGKKYLSCVIELPFLGKIHIAMFHIRDEDRKSPNSPNYSILWSAPRKNSDGRSDEENKPDNPFNDENIPF